MTVIEAPTPPRLSQTIGRCRLDPLGYVMYAFPWGRPGTALASESGPEPWQREVLQKLGAALHRRNKTSDEAVRQAVASGHGVGKSALVAWIILWALSTLRDTRGVVTANTEGQLRTKTWPELAKWHGLAVNKHWFTYTATSLFYSEQPGHERTWRVDAITWSENNTEAIAGLHNKGRRAFALFDEASSIADGVWETIEGALTDAGTELFWLAFGNPTRTTGRFRECFAGGRFAHRWQPQQIDSRSVSMTNKAQIATWVHDYGEDSDFVRVRVKGEFPRSGTMQFIDSERVQQAVERELFKDPTAAAGHGRGHRPARRGPDRDPLPSRPRCPLDPAGEVPHSRPHGRGRPRHGAARTATSPMPCSSTAPASAGASSIAWASSAAGPCAASTSAGRADRTDGVDARVRYANKRAEMWGYMKEWCKFGCLPDDRDLRADLTNVEYGYDASDAILLERKRDMRRRGLASPDDGDALALTFAYPVERRNSNRSGASWRSWPS